ncbi:MAG: hypothetical protein M3Z48_01870, partial [Lactobacillus sp.]|nr:hypothetical protein [Lactobacillus sp.]
CAVKAAVKNGTLERKSYDQFLQLQEESQSTQSYLDAKTAKKLSRKAEGKREAMSKHNYRKPPM